jgi:hypothetical protein
MFPCKLHSCLRGACRAESRASTRARSPRLSETQFLLLSTKRESISQSLASRISDRRMSSSEATETAASSTKCLCRSVPFIAVPIKRLWAAREPCRSTAPPLGRRACHSRRRVAASSLAPERPSWSRTMRAFLPPAQPVVRIVYGVGHSTLPVAVTEAGALRVSLPPTPGHSRCR